MAAKERYARRVGNLAFHFPLKYWEIESALRAGQITENEWEEEIDMLLSIHEQGENDVEYGTGIFERTFAIHAISGRVALAGAN